MTNTTWTSAPAHATDALFRTWGSALNAGLAAVGMVQTADAGQIDWTTVVRAGINADAGYEIWKFNDALQSTVPIFFKLYYGTGAATNLVRIRLESGTGSDGSGTLTGLGSGTISTVNASTATADTTARDNWAASDGSGLVLALWGNSTRSTSRTIIVVERFRDTEGTPLNKGWYVQFLNDTAKGTTIRNTVDAVVSTMSVTPCFVPFTATAGTSYLDFNNSVVSFPHYVGCKRGVFGSKMILSYVLNDLGYDNQQYISHLGRSRTYRSLGSFVTNAEVLQSTFSAFIWWSD